MQIVSEVSDVVAAAAKMGIKVEWIDKVLGEIGTKKNLYGLLQETSDVKKTKSKSCSRGKKELSNT